MGEHSRGRSGLKQESKLVIARGECVASFSFFFFVMILRLTALTALAVILVTGVSCDSHSWEETRVLHGYGKHHGEAHGKDEHAKDAGHGEKPAEHAAEGAKKEH